MTDKIIAAADWLRSGESLLRQIIANDNFGEVINVDLETVFQNIKFADLETNCNTLKEKRAELEDTTRLLKHVRNRRLM